MNAAAFCLCVLGCPSPPIRQALSVDIYESDLRAHRVVKAELRALSESTWTLTGCPQSRQVIRFITLRTSASGPRRRINSLMFTTSNRGGWHVVQRPEKSKPFAARLATDCGLGGIEDGMGEAYAEFFERDSKRRMPIAVAAYRVLVRRGIRPVE